jgi:hypothetical protein
MGAAFFVHAQEKPLYFKDAVAAKRLAFYNNAVKEINKAFALPINTENEEAWQDAFYNIGLIQYKTPLIQKKIDIAASKLTSQSEEFQKAFINLVNSNYPNRYLVQVKGVFENTRNSKLMAMAANYLLPKATKADVSSMMSKVVGLITADTTDNAILYQLAQQITNSKIPNEYPSFASFFAKDYLQGEVIVFSFQRKDRNYPGMAIVRDREGKFIKKQDGKFFTVGQLARSNSNMPGYITNGNTPQGVFKMTGFDTSTNYFIGPTTNIQLAMPHEYNRHYNADKLLVDSTWSYENYKDLLPVDMQNFQDLYGVFFAGKAGRTEIISHGTTIDVNYYKKNIFYPYTPTAGCLCTKEIWNSKTGNLEVSDQKLLTEAVVKAGGAKGYLIVIELDDKKAPVTITDIIKYLQ